MKLLGCPMGRVRSRVFDIVIYHLAADRSISEDANYLEIDCFLLILSANVRILGCERYVIERKAVRS